MGNSLLSKIEDSDEKDSRKLMIDLKKGSKFGSGGRVAISFREIFEKKASNGGQDHSYTEPSFERFVVVRKSRWDLVIISENFNVLAVRISPDLKIHALRLPVPVRKKSKFDLLFRRGGPSFKSYKRKGLFHSWKIKTKKNIEDVVVYNRATDTLLAVEREWIRVIWANGREKEYATGPTKYTKMIQLQG